MAISRQNLHPLRRAQLVLVAIIAVIGLGMSAVSTPAAKADSYSMFCSNVWLGPLGNPGDRCYQNQAYTAHYAWLRVWTNERAGCVQGVGYYGEPYTNWVCAPRESRAEVFLPDDGGGYRGVIRNNNVNNGGRFSGTTICCYSPN